MFQNTNSLRTPCFRGFWVHSLKTSDKVLRYGENNQVEFSEHPTVVQRGNERTINIYAAIPNVAIGQTYYPLELISTPLYNIGTRRL